MLYDPKWEVPTTPITARDVLILARAKIEQPQNWLNCLPTDNDEANGRFCSARAIWNVTDQFSPVGHAAIEALHKVMDGHVPNFNDTHTHAEVLAAWDKAIAATA